MSNPYAAPKTDRVMMALCIILTGGIIYLIAREFIRWTN